MCWGFKGQNKGQTRFEAAKTLETMWFQGFRVVRGTGLELMQRVLILCCQRPDGVANTGFFEATVPAHAERCYLILPL